MANFWDNDPEVTGGKNTSNFWANDSVVAEEKPKKGQQRAAADAPDFSRGMGNIPGGIQNIYGAAKTVAGVGAKKLGFEDTGTSLIKSGLESMEAGESKQLVKESDEFTNAWEKGIGTVITDWLPYQMGAGVGNLIETLGAMGIGAVAGAGVGSLPTAVAAGLGKTLLKTTVKETAEKILKDQGEEEAQKYVAREAKKALISMGATAGLGGQAALHGVGEVGGRAIEEAQERGGSAEDINLDKVLPMAGVHAVADFISNKILLNATKPIKPADKKVLDSLTLEIGKRVFITGAKESVPETVQSVAERFGAELSLSDAGAIKEYINTIAASFGMSVIPGGIGAVRSKLAASVPEDKTKTQEDALIKAGEQPVGETTTEAGTETELPPFSPVLVNGIVFNSQADLDAYNQNPAAPVGATSTSEETLAAEIATMEAKYSSREEDIKNKKGGNKAVKNRINSNAILKKEIDAKKAELAAATATVTTPAPSADVDGTNLTPGANGQVTPPAAPVPPVVETPAETPAREYTAPEQAAVDLVKAVDAGGVPTDTRKINKIARDLGLEVSTKARPEDTLNRIKDAVGRIDTTQVETSAAPVATEVVKETPPQQQAPLPTAREATPEEQKAIDHIDGIDNLGKSFSPAQAKKVAQAVGIQIPKGTKEKPVTLQDINQIIRNYVGNLEGVLAGRIRQIAPNVFEGTFTTNTKKVKDRVSSKLPTEEPEGNRVATPETEKETPPLAGAKLDEAIKAANAANKTRTVTTEGNVTTVTSKLKKAISFIVAAPLKFVKGYKPTKTPSAENFLNQTSYYGEGAPSDINQAITMAAHDMAADAIDSLDDKKGLTPALRAIAGKGVPINRPDQLMSMDKLVELYKKFVNKRNGFANVGGDGRTKAAANRQAFIESLAPEQRAKYDAVYEKAFVQAIKDDIYVRDTTESDKRKGIVAATKEAQLARRRAKYKERLIADMQEQVEEAKETDQERDEKTTKAFEEAEQAALEAREKPLLDSEAKLDREEEKQEVAEAKSEEDKRLESAINGGEGVKGVLQILADYSYSTDKPHSARNVGVFAKSLLNLLKQTGFLDQVKLTISFGKVEGTNDGKFNPVNSRATLQGVKGVYTGERDLGETVLHEIMHYFLDHVFDNPDAYIKSLPVEKQAEAQAAINRIRQNWARARTFLPNSFQPSISTLKEFVAEVMSNSKLQSALIALDANTGSDKTYAPKDNFFTRFVKNITAAMGIKPKDVAVNYKELIEDITRVISLPSKGIRGNEVSYSAQKNKKTQQTKKASTPLRTGNIGIGEKNQTSNEEYMLPEEVVGRDKGFWRKLFTTEKGWQNVARLFQNDRYPIKSWQDTLELADAIVNDLSAKFNNIYTQITLSSGRAKDLYERHVAGPAQALDTAINNFAKATGLDIKAAIAQLHMIVEAIHERERRVVKFMLLVPLDSTSKVVNSKGKLISPAARRQEIVGEHDNNKKGELDDPNLTPAQARQLRTELDYLVKNYAKETGYSPSGIKVALDGNKRKNTDIKNEAYNVVGIDPDTADARRAEIASKDNKFKAEIDEVSAALKGLHEATKTLDMQSNYWSKPVSNRVAFYGFENYIPLKGRKGEKVTTIDEMLDFTSSRMGSEVDKPQSAFGGRMSVATNPLLQSMSDATRSALRAGRKNITQSIINAIDQGLLNGRAEYKKEPIPFEQRYAIVPDENTIFHYAKNGEITLIKIKDKALLNSIRRTYKAVNPLVEIANTITSTIGQFHTRYNYSFGPMNFVRDILTNAFAMGVDLGPTKSLAFIGDISAKVANGGLFKAMRFIAMYNRGDFTSIANLAKQDPFVQDMLDFYTEGGMVTYIDGIAIKSNFEALQKELGRSGIMKTKEQVDKFVDIWTNMFELASRAAAYGVAKSSFMADGMLEQPARTKAAAYAKNLANFEQVGEIGKTMGAFYMFFRPAATGAVRAIEAVAPAFRSLDSALKSLPQAIQIGATPEAKVQRDNFIKNYKQKQQNARIMTGALFGLGMTAYAMSMAMSPDDELGRNKVKSDNMQQWSRYARFHLPNELGLGKDVVFQIPWGFGLGAFAAAGAQMAAVAFGKSTMANAAANIALQISLDSFVPIPVSKMNPLEDPLNFALDSIAPSTVRPILEFALNKNGLGQSIYNDSNRRIGDAYVGGDNIPQAYKDVARTFAQITNGYIDWSPNSMYFLANSYADGVSRILETAYGFTDLASGRKEFNIKADLPLAGSFFGTRSNVDSREFSAVEKQILAKEQRLNMFKGDPEATMRYHSEYPMDEMIVKKFNTMVNGELKRLRTDAKNFRLMEGLSPKERDSIVKMITLQQNLIKNNIIETFKAYDIEP